ncbi:hypothetical protein ACFYU8_18755 [Brevibacillus sp. NPDC003359]|uniref:hypothetical protein n=1 Tax=unclassified Brevibacillus TaxID=2684853 RepID=UPI00368BA5E5
MLRKTVSFFMIGSLLTFLSFTTIVEAKGGGGARSTSGFSSSRTTSSPSISKPSVASPSKVPSSTSSGTNSNVPKQVAPSTNNKSSERSTKPSVSSNNSNQSSGKKETSTERRVYNSNGSYANYLLTGAGIYLILNGFDETGEPIYEDAETGEEISKSDLDSVGVQVVEQLPEDFTAEHSELPMVQPQIDSVIYLIIPVVGFCLVLFAGLLIITRIRR